MSDKRDALQWEVNGSSGQAILNAVLTTTEDAIITDDAQGRIISWNPAAERIFGYTSYEAIGRPAALIIPAEGLAEERYIQSQILQGKVIRQLETLRLRKDGIQIPVGVNVSPVRNSEEIIIGTVKVIKEVAERRLAGEKQAMLAAIIGSSDDTIVSKTLEGKITSWNRAAERMFGYTEAEAIGQHISLIIPVDRLDEETYIIGQVSKGSPVDHFETVRLAKDGRLIPISLCVSPIVDERGHIIGASKIARDISEYVAAQQEKARLYDEIKALNDKKDEFIGLASHELKTPLTSIQGYLQILKGDLRDDRRKEFLHRAVQQVKKLNGLVSDLLDISRIRAGQLRFNFSTFDLCQTARDAVELIASANTDFRIHLHTCSESILLDGDAQRIEQVILNLLTNAVRYSNGARDIEVYVDAEDNLAKVSVKDQGIGIAPDQIDQIFTRFYRVSENSNVSGLGLGLYLSRQIISRHEGRIDVESEPGKGSLFYFTMPISKT